MSIVGNRGNVQNVSSNPISGEDLYKQQNILITRDDFVNYLTKMAELVHAYNTYDSNKDEWYVRRPISTVIESLNKHDVENKHDVDLIKNLLNLLTSLRERIGVLSHNVFTQSAERIKIYTNLYTVIFIYLKQKNVGNDIKLEDVAESLLTGSGLTRKFFSLTSTPAYKAWGRKKIVINGQEISSGGKSNKNKNKNKNKNIKKAKTKRRRS